MNKFSLLLIFLVSIKGISQSGTFDSTFNGNGINSYCLNQTFSNISSGIQSTGEIVCFGFNYTECGVSLTRYSSDGSIDISFGNNGSIENSICTVFDTSNNNYYSLDMVIQSDDSILIMGLKQGLTNSYWVVRLTADGTLDTTFNDDGYLDLSFGSQQDRGTCIALQSDGKILVGGTSGNTSQYFSVARLNPNGSLDMNFGIGGKVQTPFSGSESFANCIAVQNDGKIILGGYTVNAPNAKDFALIRYENNGDLDNTFGTNGKVITTLSTSFSDYIDHLEIDTQGRIIASGCYDFESVFKLAMVRYTSVGALDTTFGSNGKVITDTRSKFSDATIQVDGKIVLVGGYDGDVFDVLRYQDNGIIDSSFGNNGLVSAFTDIPTKFASDVIIQTDNKIVVCGSVLSPSFDKLCSVILRLDPGLLANEQFFQTTLKVYPNPTSDLMYLNIKEPFEYAIYDLSGAKIKEGKLKNEESEITINALASGYYILQLNDSNGNNQTLKFVKQ